MKKIVFDTGVEEYQIGGGVLRFNPSDLNMYSRFFQAEGKMLEIEKELEAQEKQAGDDHKASLEAAHKADKKIKKILSEIFGTGNDFEAIFQGVNCTAVGHNGERVITNFLIAVTPIIKDGAERVAKAEAQNAVAKANLNRAQRKALK